MKEEIYKDIQSILALSDIHPADCIKINNLIIELAKENKQLKDNWNMLKEHLKNRYDNGTESISYRQVFMEIREVMQVLEIQQELEQGSNNNE